MRFLLDASLSFRFARALDGAYGDQHQIESVRSYFDDESLKDQDFLPVLKAEGDWVVLTADRGRKDGDWHVWLASGLTIFFLKSGLSGRRAPMNEVLSKLMKHWPDIVKTASSCEEGTCFYLAKNGTITKV